MKTPTKLLENTRQYRKTPKGILTNMFHHHKSRAKKYGYQLTYNLKYLHKRFLKDKLFISLCKKWVESGYMYYEKPSIDRKNPNEGYTPHNIQMMTWKENRIKGDLEVSQKKFKPVTMFSMGGEKIKCFSSIKQAVIETGLNQSLISNVCNKIRTHTGKYRWQFTDENPELLK